MYLRIYLPLLATVTLCWLGGCSSDDQADNRSHPTAATTGHHQKKDADDDDDHNMEDPPRVGMTKAQVRAKYGDPKERNVSDEGEDWVYRLNLGEAAVRGLNPFDFSGGRVRFGHINFGPDGRVKRFRWDAGDH